MNGALNGPIWAKTWESILGLPPGAPEWLVAVLAIACAYVFVIVPAATVMSFVERKLGADLQARVGPNRAGPAGMFQPVADLMKLLQKEKTDRSSWREGLWLAVHTMALYSTVAVLPLGSAVLMIDTDMSAFLPFWAALVFALGTMLLGLNQASVSGWFGGIRVASQALAGVFPAIVAVMCAGVRAGGYKWSMLANAQSSSPFGWAVFSNPFEFLAFLVFVASGMVLLGVAPLDGGLSGPDLHGGVASHLSGRKYSLFKLGRFYGFFLWSVISSVIFLGGWLAPQALVSMLKESDSWLILELVELTILMIKTFALMIAAAWIARVNPRVRSDQITDLSWKVLSPVGLFALIGVAGWTGWTVFR